MARHRMRRCAARGCTQNVNRSLLMCITHWRLVPRDIKREINAAYRERGSNPDAPVSQRYANALVAAVRAVKTIEDAQASAGVALDPETLFVHPDDHSNPLIDQWSEPDPPSLAINSATEYPVISICGPLSVEGDVCADCNGRGGTISGEMQGDPDSYRTAYVEFFESCAACVDNLLCPGCMRPAPTIDADDIDAFICELCGWRFERSRFDPDEPEYDDYDYTRDDFNFDADRERRSK